VAALGDSITAGSPGWDPDPAVRGGIQDPDPESSWEHWASLADPRLEFRNCGVYGERTDEIATRLDGCAGGAAALIVQGGINDIAQGRAVKPAAENLRAMVRRGLAAGLDVALADVLPWNNGWPRAEAPIRELNELVRAVAVEEGIPLLGFYDTLEGPEQPGRMLAEWTSDGDHPSAAGYRLLGELVARELGPLWGVERRAQ
jgi:lysophospholipase L1-like esterase